ncbi:hypothetical protein H6G00_00820 [Leptolyngbya sp. FACHB-541]|uniref:hypothetical protein n=1 Tax=Leptolyngbya sp. FACHB-541 TaxID=2692810 RepID=UPI0016868DD3|nr:hypothetical protein [Leptolyngbya sp. FACHB-541]MBD1995170.1 hypothetical protein [Leptolyngbya sp. FACHB-541]
MTDSLPLMPDIEPNIIFTNAWFRADNYQPAIYWQLNQQNGLLSLTEARARAQAIFQAIGYAEGEAAIVKGFVQMYRSSAQQQPPKGFGISYSQHLAQAENEALVTSAHLREFLKEGRSPLIEGIEVIFGLKTRKALINVFWYGEKCQWETVQALNHAIGLIETAEAAESDAYFRWFLMERIGISVEEAYPMIAEFQGFRQRRQLEELFEGGDRHESA